jgi:hypothetical protein
MNKKSKQKIDNIQIESELNEIYHDLGKSEVYISKIKKIHKLQENFTNLTEDKKERVIKNYTKLVCKVYSSKEEIFKDNANKISKWIDPDDPVVKKYIHCAAGLHFSPFPTRKHVLPRLIHRYKHTEKVTGDDKTHPEFARFNSMFKKIVYQKETAKFKVAIKYGRLDILKFFVVESGVLANKGNLSHLLELAMEYDQKEITTYLLTLKGT